MTPSLPRAEAHLAVEIERIARSGDAAVLRYLDELLTVEDVAAWIRVEPATVYRWVSRGTAPRHSKVGDLVRFRRADVRAWLVERTVEPASAPPRRYRRRPTHASHAARRIRKSGEIVKATNRGNLTDREQRAYDMVAVQTADLLRRSRALTRTVVVELRRTELPPATTPETKSASVAAEALEKGEEPK